MHLVRLPAWIHITVWREGLRLARLLLHHTHQPVARPAWGLRMLWAGGQAHVRPGLAGDTLAVPSLETLLDQPVFKECAQGLYGK